jgi:hypothetical protein
MYKYAQIRSNLNGLKQKLNSDLGKIAYMGSSVTVQKEGYRIFVQQFFQDYFNQEHLEIEAAIGGVGSITGVFTMNEDVINYAPDLCFVEYMASDRIEANTPQSEIGKVAEGIVRKLQEINCQIVFLYRYVEHNLINHRYNYALSEYEKIAEHYQITSINFGSYIHKCIEQKKYTHQELFKDHTHTTKLGSQVAANCIINIFKNIFKNSPNKLTNLQDSNVRIPIYPDNYYNTKVTYVEPSFLANLQNYLQNLCSDKVKNHHGQSKDYHYLEIASDNSFKFQIKGKLVGFMVIVGRDSGVAEFSDNNQVKKIKLWDQWCHYDRFNTTIVLKEYRQLTAIELKITDELIDYSSCRRKISNPESIVKKIKLVGIMTQGNSTIIPGNNNDHVIQAFQSKKGQDAQAIITTHIKAIKINSSRQNCLKLAEYLIANEARENIKLMQVLKSYRSPTFYQHMANVFYDLKEFEKSIICYRRAINLNYRLAEDLLPIMHQAKLKQNKHNQAVKIYKNWIENYYIINHKYKIIYCPIPKNACTFFKEILIENSEHQADFKQSKLDVHRYIRQNEVKLTDFSCLSNSEYLKIAIIRNPYDRLVSGYFNKFVKPQKVIPIVKNIVNNVYEFQGLEPDHQKSITFSQFIEYLSRTDDSHLNEHWRSQYFFLGMGLVKFDVLDSLENISEIVQHLEVRLGIKISDRKIKNKTNYIEPENPKNWHQMYPQELRKFQKLPTTKALYTDELIALVQHRYALDLEMYQNLRNNLKII